MPIAQFSHWTLVVADLDRSTRFYTDVMGWRLVGADEDSSDEAWGSLPDGRALSARARRFVRDGQRVELASFADARRVPERRPEVHHLGLSHMTVATAPAGEVMRRLKEIGVVVRAHTLGNFVPEMGDDGTQFLFEDPDGNIIETFASREDWNAFGGVGDSDDDGGAPSGICHLSHWSLCVSDPDRSLPFYRAVLGWEQVGVMEWAGAGPSTVMDVGPARLTTWLLGVSGQRIEIIHFAQPPSPARVDAAGAELGLGPMTVVVDDVDRAAADLAAAGVDSVITKGRAGEALAFTDPDGNLLRGVPTPPVWS